MMKILSIGTNIHDNRFDIDNITFNELLQIEDMQLYDYILISGGDGLIRRVIQTLHIKYPTLPPFILNAVGSFNVIAKLNRVPSYQKILDRLIHKEKINLKKQSYYGLNNEIFLFSAGNMGDLQHIFLSENLRFGIIKNGMVKYALSMIFLFPVHLIMTPFMLISSKKFFIFTPAKFIKKFANIYGVVPELTIDLENNYNFIELDGDVVTIQESKLHIKPLGFITIATK